MLESVIRLTLMLFAGLAAVLAAGMSAIFADSEDEFQTGTFVTTLEPGDNFIGWVNSTGAGKSSLGSQ